MLDLIDEELDQEIFKGYCFFEDGKYCPPVTLTGIDEARQYLFLQMNLHYRVIIEDGGGLCVGMSIKGKIVFPKINDN